ncbi:hypothetical protein AB0J86_00660 [Micromonospora sp. NPDC049559]|uniref:hypothetical protein n=1 Tax=Micromonospora sp. NPDC049559 TaxID=3155923 RepID=UPI003433EABE
MAEPDLKIRQPPTRPGLAPVLVLGLVGLLVMGLPLVVIRPARTPAVPAVTVVKGKMASKVDFFRDSKVREILRRKQIEVLVDNTGSREIATHDVDKYDFVFPSGQPAADLIMSTRLKSNKEAHAYLPFVSPIVLATYRPYARALQDAGVATAMNPNGSNPLYYKINLGRFVQLSEVGVRWNDIGIRNYGIENSNLVLAHTADVCLSNSGGTYQGLIAYAKNNGRAASAESEVAALAQSLKPLYRAQGAPTADRVPYYLSPEGMRIAPIVVIYEHQYLAHQLRRPQGKPDEDRVLLYPADHFETQPSFIALNESGRKVGDLLRTDPELRARAVELGFRVLDADQDTASPLLAGLLAERGIEVPPSDNNHTRAYLPPLDLFEKLIITIGGC